jgi:hypothetical protein
LFVIILSIPLRDERVRADGEFIRLRFLHQHAHQLSIRVINAKADRAFERRWDETDAHAARR